MSYVKENLTRGERIIYTTNLHWIIFVESVFIISTGLLFSYLGVRYQSNIGSTFTTWIEYLSMAILAFGGVKFLLELIRHNTSEFAVTNERIIIKVGVLQRKSLAMHLNKIESIEIDQSIAGRIFGFGAISITGTGNADSNFDLIKNPSKLRQKMQWIAESDDEEVEALHPKKPHESPTNKPQTQDLAVHKSTSTRRRRRRR